MSRDVAPPSASDFAEPDVACARFGLHYVSDEEPGIARRRRGAGFAYFDSDGRRVSQRDLLARIRSLAIPPAYRDVWICARPDGHLQATGRDARARKQYRYHPRWREVRDAAKYDRILAFGALLPRLRRRVRTDLARPGLPREKVLAIVVRLLELTLIRVGNDEYARTNRSFGLTTLLDRHVVSARGRLFFRFRGKSGQQHDVALGDARLCRLVKRCRDLPGQALFQFIDDNGKRCRIGSGDVNDYIRDATGADFTAKDFRTWAATVIASAALARADFHASAHARRKEIVAAVTTVSRYLGNTPAVCRKSYIHPAVFAAYEEGTLAKALGTLPADSRWRRCEQAVLKFLHGRERAARRTRGRLS